MAALAGIKDALSPDGEDCFGIGPKTVGDAEIARIKTWFEATYANALDGRAANADDFAAFLWRQIANQVKQYEKSVAEAALDPPAELTEAV